MNCTKKNMDNQKCHAYNNGECMNGMVCAVTNTLHLTDCMKYMSQCKDNAFDLAIVDPPYGIDIGNRKRSEKLQFKQFENKDWDKKRPDQEYFTELYRISNNQIIWGANYFTKELPVSKGWIFWDKDQHTMSFPDGELAFTSFDCKLKVFHMNRGAEKGFLDRTGNIHPTQKPVALYKWLLQNYAKPGDKLLDTHSGSGSFRIAAHDLGFDLVSCELDPDYYRDNESRYQNHIKQGDLFDSREVQSLVYKQNDL